MRVFEQIFSTTYAPAGTPNNRGVVQPTTKPYRAGNSIAIPGGDLAVVAVPAPTEGDLAKVIVKQTAGTSAAFTVDVLDSLEPFGATGNYATGTGLLSPLDLYRIIAQLSANAGATAAYRDTRGQPYVNVDGDFTNQQRYVYLVITPTGAVGTTTWDAALTFWAQQK